ncbi:MAG: Rrf2 family transcriptional regulator [Spirochaetaceae bacterium]|nr:MAG: Rrf2 family transcriptional regulator [Spirochaetaceae bacterium]
MRLTVKSEYACLALIDLVEHDNKGLCKISEIAARKKIPKKYLEQILLTLNRNGYVSSRKGSEGGYRLAKAPDQISVAEVLRLMDGALAPVYSVSEYFYEPTPIERSVKLVSVFKEIRDYVSAKLEELTFDKLA